MRSGEPTDVPPYFWTIRAILGWASGLSQAPGDDRTPSCAERTEHERRVGPAEAERIRKRRADRHRSSGMRNEIEVAPGIGIDEIRGRRRDLVSQRQHGEHGLDPRRGAEQVTGHRLGRRYGELRNVVTERALDRDALGD